MVCEEKQCKTPPKSPAYPNAIVISPCKRPPEKPHPCDPQPPCKLNTEDQEGGECIKPFLCIERVKNPENPEHTKCKEGSKIDAATCKKRPDGPHVCDPQPPCVPGKPESKPCPSPALCRQRIKNPEVRRVITCPAPKCDNKCDTGSSSNGACNESCGCTIA